MLAHLYLASAPNRIDAKNCFEILGFDILLDEGLEPYVMEVNHTPSFKTSSEVDREIKFNLIKDTLSLIYRNKPKKVENQQRIFEWDMTTNN